MSHFGQLNHLNGMRGGLHGSQILSPFHFHNPRLLTAILAGLVIYSVILWIFRSSGLYRMAKRRDIEHAWFAWVPILSNYVLGELIDGRVVFGEKFVTEDAEFYLPLLSLITFVSSVFSLGSWVGTLLIVLITVYKAGALWQLFKLYQPENRVSYTILSLIFGEGFFIFAIRNNELHEDHKEKIYGVPYSEYLAYADGYSNNEFDYDEKLEAESIVTNESLDQMINALKSEDLSLDNELENETNDLTEELEDLSSELYSDEEK